MFFATRIDSEEALPIKSPFMRLILVLGLIALAGCQSQEPDGNFPAESAPTDFVEDCPVSGFKPDKLLELVENVRAIKDDSILGPTQTVKAGYLAMALAQMGASEQSLMRSMQTGKFAALASWFASSVRVVDMNKFSKCEGN